MTALPQYLERPARATDAGELARKEKTKMASKSRQEYKDYAQYLRGYADSTQNPKLAKAADLLENAGDNICDQGYFGCYAGDKCTSDHK
jgi:hypothetical protein